MNRNNNQRLFYTIQIYKLESEVMEGLELWLFIIVRISSLLHIGCQVETFKNWGGIIKKCPPPLSLIQAMLYYNKVSKIFPYPFTGVFIFNALRPAQRNI